MGSACPADRAGDPRTPRPHPQCVCRGAARGSQSHCPPCAPQMKSLETAQRRVTGTLLRQSNHCTTQFRCGGGPRSARPTREWEAVSETARCAHAGRCPAALGTRSPSTLGVLAGYFQVLTTVAPQLPGCSSKPRCLTGGPCGHCTVDNVTGPKVYPLQTRKRKKGYIPAPCQRGFFLFPPQLSSPVPACGV